MYIDKESFRKFTTFHSESGCWYWTGKSTNPNLYGNLRYKGRTWLAHRLAFKLFKGSLKKLQVCHKCDVPRCCNPDHLFLGTAGENQKDAYAKGRQIRKFFNRSKLTLEMVIKIKQQLATGISMKVIAKELGVKYFTVNNIANGTNFYWIKAV